MHFVRDCGARLSHFSLSMHTLVHVHFTATANQGYQERIFDQCGFFVIAKFDCTCMLQLVKSVENQKERKDLITLHCLIQPKMTHDRKMAGSSWAESDNLSTCSKSKFIFMIFSHCIVCALC